jgi:Fic family protein
MAGSPRAVAPSPVPYTDHLVGLLSRAEAASARIAGADPDRRAQVATGSRIEAARRSTRLDASPLTDETADDVDARLAAGQPPTDAAPDLPPPPVGSRGWANALKLDGMQTQEVAAVEYANVLAALDAEAQLAEEVFERPLEVLATAHGLLCHGLVDPEVVGRPRRTEQAMHDGAQGLVLYHAPAPEELPALLEGLGRWLGDGSATLPAVVVAGVVHERILEWLPYEASNGRLARVAARLVLRARGVDPQGLAVPERSLAEDPVGYYGEVAATVRRRGDLGPWLERWAEAVCTALEDAADAVDPRPGPALSGRARALAGTLTDGATITLREHAEGAGVRREAALADLRELERAGALRALPRSRGLRWRRVGED